MKKKLYIVTLFSSIFISCEEKSVQPEWDTNNLALLEVVIDHDNYVTLLSNKTNDFETGCRLSYKGLIYNGIISSSGAGSRYVDKWAYKINLEEEQFIEGLNEFSLSSQIYDLSALRNTITSFIYKQAGFPIFNSHHVFVKINGKNKGLYPMIERIEDEFFEQRNLKAAELFKLGFDSRFTFSEVYNVQFYFEKKIPGDNNFNSLTEFINACDTVSSERIHQSLGKFLDIQNYLKYHAVTSIINNIDAFTNNFFLWKENPGSPFKIIPWDFDKAFSGLPSGKLAGYNQIAVKLFSNKDVLLEYKNLLLFYNDKLLNESALFPIIDSTAAVIKEGYKKDPYLGLAGRNLDEEIQKLKNYISQRHKYIKENAQAYNGL